MKNKLATFLLAGGLLCGAAPVTAQTCVGSGCGGSVVDESPLAITAAASPYTALATDSGRLLYCSEGDCTAVLPAADGVTRLWFGGAAYGFGVMTIDASSTSLSAGGDQCSALVMRSDNGAPSTALSLRSSALGAWTVDAGLEGWYCVPSDSIGVDERIYTQPGGRKMFYRAWTNAQVVELGPTTDGSITLQGFPLQGSSDPLMRVTLCSIRLTGQAAGPTTLVAFVGWSGTSTAYLASSSLKAAVGTVYGDTLAEQGTTLQNGVGNLRLADGFAVTMALQSSGGNLDAVTGSAGVLRIWYEQIQ